MSAARSVVAVERIGHNYDERVALDDVSFEINAGERFGLVGPNGGGKTTLLAILSTLLKPSSGVARIDGHDVVTDRGAARRRIGVVFQHASLDGYLTPRENLRHQGHLYGLRGAPLRARVEAMLAVSGAGDRIDDRVAELSGGLRRRVELAKGLLHEPAVLLLDEPTVGLDPGGRREFWEHLDQLRKQDGVAVLAATHLMEEAERCDRVAILDRGRVVALGAPDALRSEIRGDVITLEAEDAVRLARGIAETFGAEPQVVDGAVRIERPDGAEAVPRLAEAFPGLIRSITVGKPTLEDVFVQRTGRPFVEADDE